MTTNTRSLAAVYLDATVLSCLHDTRPALAFQASVTRRWWRTERDKFRLYLSSETLNELSAGKYPSQDAVLRDARQVEILPRQTALDPIIRSYIAEFVMPRGEEGDAAHLAYASFYRMDYLLTWNCNHLANANKYDHIRGVNGRLRLVTPMIITPLGLFEETGT
jgi:hypothetical protein